MKKLATEKNIAKLAVRIGDRSHDLAQTYIKLLPKLVPAQKAYDAAEQAWNYINERHLALVDDGALTTWPVMMADLAKDVSAAEQVMFRLGDIAFELETKLEIIDSALYEANSELRID